MSKHRCTMSIIWYFKTAGKSSRITWQIKTTRFNSSTKIFTITSTAGMDRIFKTCVLKFNHYLGIMTWEILIGQCHWMSQKWFKIKMMVKIKFLILFWKKLIIWKIRHCWPSLWISSTWLQWSSPKCKMTRMFQT